MKKVAIIGASGLLGAHLIEEALERQYTVTAIARKFPVRSAGHFYRERIRQLTVDIADLTPTQLGQQDLIINVAARVEASGDDLIEDNLKLVKKVAQLFKSTANAEFIHISSVATMSSGENGAVISEKDHGNFRPTAYALSKYLCDQWLEQNLGLPYLAIHPCYMLGKWDAKPSSGAILLALQLKKIKAVWNQEKNFVHARDVAKGIFQAREKGVKGRFLLGGTNLFTEDFLRRCLGHLALNPELGRLTSPELLEPLSQEFFLSNPVNDNLARENWGYTSNCLIDDMILETINYFREYRLLPRNRGLP